jgi:urea transport system permease protein
MYRAIKILLLTLCLAMPAFATVLKAQEDIHPLVDALGLGDFPEREAAIKALVASKDPKVSQILQLLSDGQLYVNPDGGPVLLQGGTDDEPTYSDPISGEAASDVDPDLMTKVKINNSLRGVISSAMSQLTLLSPDRGARLAAAQGLLKDADPANLDLLNSALAGEKDAEVKDTMEAARAVMMLKTDAAPRTRSQPSTRSQPAESRRADHPDGGDGNRA